MVWELVVGDGVGGSASDRMAVRIQNVTDPPACDAAHPSRALLWPANHKLTPVTIDGVGDPQSADPASIVIRAVTQDEPVSGPGDTGPDAVAQGATVLLRAERTEPGNGRVYHVDFAASNRGGSCQGTVLVGVPRDASPGGTVVDNGRVYDSTRQ